MPFEWILVFILGSSVTGALITFLVIAILLERREAAGKTRRSGS